MRHIIFGERTFGTSRAAKICHVSTQTISRLIDAKTSGGFHLPRSDERRITAQGLKQLIVREKLSVKDFDGIGKLNIVCLGPDSAGLVPELNAYLGVRAVGEEEAFCAAMRVAEIQPSILICDCSVMHPTAKSSICETLRSLVEKHCLRLIVLVPANESQTPASAPWYEERRMPSAKGGRANFALALIRDHAVCDLDLGKNRFSTGDVARLLDISQQHVIRCFDAGMFGQYGFRVPGSKFRRVTLEGIKWFVREKTEMPFEILGLPEEHRVVLWCAEDSQLVGSKVSPTTVLRVVHNAVDAGMTTKEHRASLLIIEGAMQGLEGALAGILSIGTTPGIQVAVVLPKGSPKRRLVPKAPCVHILASAGFSLQETISDLLANSHV